MAVKQNFPKIAPSLLLDFANTKILDPRITFARASTATYWDGKTFAKAEENLILYSQDADNAAWGKGNVTIAANSDIAPDGSATADGVVEDASEAGRLIQVSYTSPGTVQQTFSVYIKPQGRTRVRVDWANLDSYQVTFDLVGGGSVFFQGGNVSRAAITESANGFYRCEMVFTPNSSLSAIRIKATDSVGVNGVAFAVWGAQLEQRSQATAYIPTTDKPITKYQPVLRTAASGAPRFDHNPVTGESMGLLIEEQRTNLLTYSSDFTNAVWKKDSATITANAIVAPDGTVSGSKLVATVRLYWFDNTGVTGAKVQSIYAKAEAASTITISAVGGQNVLGGNMVTVDLLTGAVTTGQAAPNVVVTSVGNGWYRIAILVDVTVASGNSTYWQTVATEGVYIWGAQLEAGAFATSYIPTTSAQVTRAAETVSMGGSNFSSWHRDGEGSLYVQAEASGKPARNDGVVVLGRSDVSNHGIRIQQSITPKVYLQMVDNGSSLVASEGEAWTGGQEKSIAIAYKAGDFAYSSSGSAAQIPTYTVGTVPYVDELRLGTWGRGAATWCGTIKKIAYYPKRLSDAELQALTA